MRFRSILALLVLAAPVSLAAQSPFSGDGGVSSGIIYKRYSFGSTYPTKNVEQIAVPFGVVIPIGRQFSVDIGTYYANTKTHDAATGDAHTLDGFTDTQVRGSYVFGNDRLVLSLMLNLPTGAEKQTQQELDVSSAIASNFLLFPVASYGNGFSGTLGAAVAVPAGGWNLGLSASGRLSAKYQPYDDPDTAISNLRYKPGFEGRVRVGADHLIGASRLALGFTLSTFSNDQATGGGSPGAYSPATRYISQVSLTSPIGSNSLAVYAWDYYRSSSKSDSLVGFSSKENIFTVGAQLGIQAGPKVSIQPLIEARVLGSAPASGSGFLFGGGATARLEVTPRFSLIPGARYDTGHIKSTAVGQPSVTGFEGSLRLRYAL